MKPGEHKTVQARILQYAEDIGWAVVSREKAEQRCGFDPDVPPAERAKNRSLFFDDLLDAKVRDFNPRYAEAEGALPGQFRHLHTDIYGNREFVEHLRNRGKFFDHEEKRERDLILIDYDDPARNVYEVTEEWAFNNGHYGTREDVVFLINGIPVLVIECKNANKDEAIALGVDQIRRYHRERNGPRKKTPIPVTVEDAGRSAVPKARGFCDPNQSNSILSARNDVIEAIGHQPSDQISGAVRAESVYFSGL